VDYWRYLTKIIHLILYATPSLVGLLIWYRTHKNSRFRGLLTYLLHLSILVFGLVRGGLIGLLYISLPLLVFYYYFLIHVAMVVVPAPNPRNRREWFQRVFYFFFYMWGSQYPGWSVTSSTGRDIEIRIKGDQHDQLSPPGLVYAYSHQVVGLTTGINFSRAESSGTVFTRPTERPIDGVIDLRKQLRSFWIDVVSSDGIPYKAQLVTAFVVDKEKWDYRTLHRLYMEDHLLKDAGEPDVTEGSFPFSRLRIRALLSATGIRFSETDRANDEPENNEPANMEEEATDRKEPERTYWDELVMYHVEKTASDVLSQKRFDELWLPLDDYEGACAADGIAQAIRDRCSFDLLCWGVRFLSCQLVNFEFTREKLQQPGEVELKQIAAWQADWQQDAMETRAQANAEAELLQQGARAYAYATLLTAVAEGLQETNGLDSSLPRNLIALRFIGALEEMLQRQPGEDGKSETSSALNQWKIRLSLDTKHE
jgi:hypothetical protein